jgi:hypothetical protein
MRFAIVMVLVFAGCGHRAELVIEDAAATRVGGDRVAVTLDVRCSLEMAGATCAELGELCATAEWVDRGRLIDAATTCEANQLREGDRLALELTSTGAVPDGVRVAVAVRPKDPSRIRGNKLPSIVIPAPPPAP